MPIELKATLIVITIIVSIYLLIVIAIGIYLIGLNRTISKKSTLINSILTQQYDIVRLLCEMIIQEGVDLPEETKLSLGLHHENRVKSMSTIEIINIKHLLTSTASNLVNIAEETALKDKKKYLVIKESLFDFSKSYRKEVVLYNQKIANHNYWIKFLLFRPFSKLFKLKRYEAL